MPCYFWLSICYRLDQAEKRLLFVIKEIHPVQNIIGTKMKNYRVLCVVLKSNSVLLASFNNAFPFFKGFDNDKRVTKHHHHIVHQG
ncbi:unnamed protein product [Cuscuta campestris]|uniref:Uncharacterized protein n=1 Tax=Cuscuta campestris TaxID=132261 RepID=A0A484MNC9_9ASTE|nr:unnamed protein product [Cuscuta campestris]